MRNIPNRSRRATLAALALGSVLAIGLTPARAADPAPDAAASTPRARLTIRDIYDRVEAAGYHDQREIELEHGRYEVKARNAKGARVKLQVNATTGAIEKERERH